VGVSLETVSEEPDRITPARVYRAAGSSENANFRELPLPEVRAFCNPSDK
jgi:hypothetical protein